MDETLWIIAILAHLTLLFVIFTKGWYVVIPRFTCAILWGLLQAPVIYEVQKYGSLEAYRFWFYGWDVCTIFLYGISIPESWNRLGIDSISASMIAYLLLKAPGYVFMALRLKEYAIPFQIVRYPNLVCLFFWIILLVKYHVQEVQFHSKE
jgi:hypothetical protein